MLRSIASRTIFSALKKKQASLLSPFSLSSTTFQRYNIVSNHIREPTDFKFRSLCSSKQTNEDFVNAAQSAAITITEPKKPFFSARSIRPLMRRDYCYIDPEQQIKQALTPAIREGSYVMLHGPSASGKSTLMYRAQELLRAEFVCLTVSMQCVDCSDIGTFWFDFSECLRRANMRYKVPLMGSAASFRRFLASNKQTKKFFGGKKVVLFVDEFDTLHYAPRDVLNSFLGTLKAIKEEGEAYCLQSFIGVGSFSIIELCSQATSPFNVTAVQIQYWSKEQVHQFFKQHATVDPRIIDDVYARTAGHPSLVCLCGQRINALNITTYEAWLDYALSGLLTHISSSTFAMMKLALTGKEPTVEAARAVLRQLFLPNLTAPVDIHVNYNEAKYLAAQGALVVVPETDTYRIPSPLVHQFLLQRVNTVDQRCIPLKPVPWHSITGQIGRRLDVQRLLEEAIACINPAVIEAAPRVSWKIAQVPGLQHTAVPQEGVYHTELFAILRQWLPADVSVTSNVNVKNDSRQSTNIVLRYSENTVLLDFVATAPITQIQEHIDSAATTKAALKAQEAWVINFTMHKPSDDCTSLTSHDVNVLHVWHDASFTEALRYWDQKAASILLNK